MNARILFLMIAVAVGFGVAGAGAAGAQALTVRLDRVPDDVVLPAASGRNLVVTAVAKGAPIRRAWLAGGAKGLELALKPVDTGVFQVNLADARVRSLIPPGTTAGSLRVFVESIDGRIVSSVPIRFRTGPPARLPSYPRIRIRTGDKARELRGGCRVWFSPDRVTSIELTNPIGGSATASVGGPFGSNTPLPITPEVARAWRDAGENTITCEGITFRLLAIPRRIASDNGAAFFRVQQRRSTTVPGLRGYLDVRCGDVTGGQVAVTVRAAGRWAPPRVSMGDGEWVPVDLDGRPHRLLLLLLVNHLIGEDFAHFVLWPEEPDHATRMIALEHVVAGAPFVFEKDGRRVLREAVVQAIARARAEAAPKNESAVAFLDRAARGSLGRISFRMPGGEPSPLVDWLRIRLAMIEGRPTQGDPVGLAADPDPRVLLARAANACESVRGVRYDARATRRNDVVEGKVVLAFGLWGDTRSPSVRVSGHVVRGSRAFPFDAAFNGDLTTRRGPEGRGRRKYRYISREVTKRWRSALDDLGPGSAVIAAPLHDPSVLRDAGSAPVVAYAGTETVGGASCHVVRVQRGPRRWRYSFGVDDLLPRRIETIETIDGKSNGTVLTLSRVRLNRVPAPNEFRVAARAR